MADLSEQIPLEEVALDAPEPLEFQDIPLEDVSVPHVPSVEETEVVEKKQRRKRKGKKMSPYAALTVDELKNRLTAMGQKGISRHTKEALIAIYEDKLKLQKRSEKRKAAKEALKAKFRGIEEEVKEGKQENEEAKAEQADQLVADQQAAKVAYDEETVSLA